MIKALITQQTVLRARKIIFFLFVALNVSLKANAQQPQALSNQSFLKINNYAVLPDKEYSLSKILSDPTLAFKPDSLRASKSGYYWVRLTIVNPYPTNEHYIFSLSQPLNYRLYVFNVAANKWVGSAAGLNVADNERVPGIVRLDLQKQTTQTIYLKIEVQNIKGPVNAIKPDIVLQKEFIFNADEQLISLLYLICCVALIGFSGYYLYEYIVLKDKAYLFYVITQLGALVYITANRLFFNLILPVRVYSLTFRPDGYIQTYTINIFYENVGTAIIFFGFIYFTCLYLRTKELLPVFNRVLKTFAYTYLGLETIFPCITLMTGYYINTSTIANVLILVIIPTVIITGIVAHKKGLKVARIFLLANLLPMILTAATSIYILRNGSNRILPVLAILSQIFTFAMALVARLKFINDDLKAQQIESIKREKDITVIEYQRLLAEEENKTIMLTIAFEKERNELLQKQLEANQRELIGNSLYIHQKNKLLADLKTHVGDVNSLDTNADPEVFKNIRAALKNGDYLNEEWGKFKVHFEQVHPSFFKDMQAAYPTLTRYELRLYAYFHINLSTKEIAALLNIAPTSVRQAKMRLYKKMNRPVN